MTLGEKQKKFTLMVAKLITWLYAHGYEVTLGDCFRDKRCPYSSTKSKHFERLAVDLNLFKGSNYLTEGKDYEEAHAIWTDLGGDEGFEKDMNHFQFSR